MANIKDLIQSIESGDSSFDEKLAAINEMEETLVAMRAQEQSAIDDNVAMIVEAIAVMQRKVEAQLEVAKAIVPEIGPRGPKGEPGERGLDGANGRDGRDGADGRNGVDGQDGVSVTDAKIDFDGSLVITLSTGREINVGEVVAPDLAEKIKLVTSGGSTSQQVLDAIAAIEATLATYGTMALQNANAVAITGGTINGTTIGSTTPNAATFTTLTATGQTSLGGAAGAEGLRVLADPTAVSFIQATGRAAGAGVRLGIGGTDTNVNFQVFAKGTGAVRLFTGSDNSFNAVEQARVSHTASAVNYVQVTGAATGADPVISAQGSDASRNLALTAKGTGQVFSTSPFVAHTAAFNNMRFSGGDTTGLIPRMNAQGSDTNVGMALISKGTGAIDLAAGSSGVNISNGGTVTAITTLNAGTNYTSIPSVAISAPTTAGGVQATASISNLNNSGTPVVVAGGTGYTNGDVLSIVGGTPTGSAATLTVTGVSGGVITSVNYTNFATYTTLPANPVSVTGGTGSGATFTVYWKPNFTIVTNAGSGYVEQPTVTFSGGGGSGAAAYASVGSATVLRSLAGSGGGSNSLSIFSAGGEAVRVTDAGGALVNYWRIQGAPTNSGVQLQATGADTNVSGLLSSKGTSGFSFYTNTFAQEQFRIAHTASAVNYVQVTGAATGGRVTLSAQGSDTNVGINYNTKGAQNHVFSTNSGNLQFVVANRASTVNWVQAQGNVAGSPPSFTVDGSDTNIDFALIPKGTGNVRFGTYTGTALSIAGYIEIKDAGGTIRKLAVVA